MVFTITIASLIAPLLVLSALAGADITGSSISRGLANQHPTLSAITSRSQFRSRGEAFEPRRDCSHHYAEDTPSLPGRNSRFAKIDTKYKLPALVLEDIEGDVENIRCSDSMVTVEFFEAQELDATRQHWDQMGAFLIISSHIGCNNDGERKPYLVSGIHYDISKVTADFSVEPLEWKQAYETMTVKFGSSPGQYSPTLFRTHEGLRRRQKPAAPASSSISPSSTTSSIIPFTTDFATSVDLANPLNSSQKLDPNIKLFEYSGTVNGANEFATVSCKNCSLSGTIDVIQGQFVVGTAKDPVGKIIDFIDDGFFEVVANNLAAHIEFDTKLSLSAEKTFEKLLGEYGLPGFSIPGIATVGPFFRPSLQSSIKLQGDLQFSYGFDLKVPNNSSMLLNLDNITDSTIAGFQNANITALPFQATSPKITLTLAAGIRGELDLGIVLGQSISGIGVKLEASAGAFLDLPSLSVAISTAPDLDVNCEPIVTNVTSLNGIAAIIPQKFSSLIKIEPAVVINLGVQAEIGVNLPGNDFDKEIQTEEVIASTQFSLPTACLSFDADKKQLATPTTTPPPPPTSSTIGARLSATITPGATQPGVFAEKSGGAKIETHLWWAGVGLASVFMIALSL